MLNIREIETIIDIEHKKSPVFDAGKEQTFNDLLAAFEDICGLILMGSMFNPLALKKNYRSNGCAQYIITMGG